MWHRLSLEQYIYFREQKVFQDRLEKMEVLLCLFVLFVKNRKKIVLY